MGVYKLSLIFVLLIFVCNSVSADLVFEEVLCYKDGSLRLKVYSEDNKISVDDVNVIARYRDRFGLIISKFEVNGSWDKDYISDEGSVFKSKDAQINFPGDYDIILEYKEGVNKKIMSWELNCVGLIFSCELINVDIKNCTNVDNKYFSLLVELSGINQSIARQIDIFEDVSYGVVAENNYKDIKGLFSNKGSLPEDIKIDKINENLYLFSKEFKNNSIKSVNIYLKSLQSECKNSKLYDYMGCINVYTSETKQDNKKEQKYTKDVKQENLSKITGNIIKVREESDFNKNYLIYGLIGSIVLLIISIIKKVKKQKVNKYV